jgi:hypothetical protein
LIEQYIHQFLHHCFPDTQLSQQIRQDVSTMSALLSKKYLDGVYIPSGLLVVGCLIVKREWVPYAIVLAALLSGYKLLSGSRK